MFTPTCLAGCSSLAVMHLAHERTQVQITLQAVAFETAIVIKSWAQAAAPFLQSLCQVRLPPPWDSKRVSVSGWVIIKNDVDVDGSCLTVYSQPKSVGLVWVFAVTWHSNLHSPDEPSELSQCLKHNNSSINIIRLLLYTRCSIICLCGSMHTAPLLVLLLLVFVLPTYFSQSLW